MVPYYLALSSMERGLVASGTVARNLLAQLFGKRVGSTTRIIHHDVNGQESGSLVLNLLMCTLNLTRDKRSGGRKTEGIKMRRERVLHGMVHSGGEG